MSAWLTIIGIGDDGVDNLPPVSRTLLDAADLIVGSRRSLARDDFGGRDTLIWASPLNDTIESLQKLKDQNVVILATGDPMHFGIAATLLKTFDRDEISVIPAPSAFSLAAARMGWPLQHIETLSLHGRPVSLLQPFVQPGARLLALTGGNDSIHDAAALLCERGFGDSVLTVLEHMGGPGERIISLEASKCEGQDFAGFNTLAIQCIASPGAQILPRVPGLPDEAFQHDGQLTKREIRAVTLSALGPTPGATLWDVGAGCGSVAIEWMRACPHTQAIAFEKNEDRISMIARNAVALGAPGLDIVQGDVERTLDENDAPSAIFLGGAVANEAVFAKCWKALPAGGRLVANAVTLEGEAALIARHAQHGGELVRMEISHAGPVGTRQAFRPRMAVTQWRGVKE